MATISRRMARETAMKALYSYDFNKDTAADSFLALLCAEEELACDDFCRTLFLETLEHLEAIDAKITEHAKGWKLFRIARMTLSILRLCTFELMYTDIPAPVAINEAIELAKGYDADDAPAFINGVLHAVAVSVREEKDKS